MSTISDSDLYTVLTAVNVLNNQSNSNDYNAANDSNGLTEPTAPRAGRPSARRKWEVDEDIVLCTLAIFRNGRAWGQIKAHFDREVGTPRKKHDLSSRFHRELKPGGTYAGETAFIRAALEGMRDGKRTEDFGWLYKLAEEIIAKADAADAAFEARWNAWYG